MKSFKIIASTDNAQFKQLKKLATTARERRKTAQTLLDGVHLLQALADRGGDVEQLVVRQGNEHDAEIEACLARFPNAPALLLAPALFDVLSPVETPVGILALYKIVQASSLASRCVVMLENVQDPGNLGSILRTAAASGVGAVYLSKGCAEAWSPKALRAAMGAHFVMSIYEQQDLLAVCEQFPMRVATELGATASLYQLKLTEQPVAFLFGNEGAGLSAELSAQASHHVIIPMPGHVESLNVAAAVAVCLFERVRQTDSL